MKDLLREIKKLNDSVGRIADSLAPRTDPDIMDRFRAFRLVSGGNAPLLQGIADPDPVSFRELRGIDDIVEALMRNTEQFLAGLPCNNVLLYGPRGTGKSSAVKALMNEPGFEKLRMIEITKTALAGISDIQEIIRQRTEKYLLFCDDLSFNEDDDSYISVKTVLEGGLGMRPKNTLMYATSNRRHLMPEKTADNLPVLTDGELHPSETLEEKVSLSDRFGLRLGFENYSMETYLEIVRNYASLRGIRTGKEELKGRAVEWSVSHGGFSGRTARQFIDDLEGQLKIGRKKLKGH